jgi:hypothetical protein
MPKFWRVVVVVVVALGGLAMVSCSSASQDSPATTAKPAASTTTSRPQNYAARVVRERDVDPVYRQGLARVDGGWIFSFNDGLFRTDDALKQTSKLIPAIPASWKARGFNHIGDIDVVDGVVYAPLEQPQYELAKQAMLTFDATTFAYTSGVDVVQHEASFVTVDPSTGIAYSMDRFGGKALVRYDVGDQWRRLPPLRMSMQVERVQGADVYGGAIWLSTDDATDAVYRVDLDTGNVDALGSVGHIDGEGEGIDATPAAAADLSVLSIDAKGSPVRLIELQVAA